MHESSSRWLIGTGQHRRLHCMAAHALASACCVHMQVGKSLYTTVRELVENSLDSAEGIGELPEIAMTM